MNKVIYCHHLVIPEDLTDISVDKNDCTLVYISCNTILILPHDKDQTKDIGIYDKYAANLELICPL